MGHVMSKLFLLASLVVLLPVAAHAGEQNKVPDKTEAKALESLPIAVGEWSQPVKALRGRLVMLQRQRGNGKTRETTVYLELHHIASAVGPPLHVRVDPKQRIDLHDAVGKPVPGEIINTDRQPEPVLVTLPYDCSMRVRLSAYNISAEDGLVIPLLSNLWRIPAGAKGKYTLTGTFVCDVQAQVGNGELWIGTLTLPRATFGLPGK
jgi:hypothetical protein